MNRRNRTFASIVAVGVLLTAVTVMTTPAFANYPTISLVDKLIDRELRDVLVDNERPDVRDIQQYLTRLHRIYQGLDRVFATMVRHLEHMKDPQKKAEAVARANEMLDKAEARLTSIAQKLQGQIQKIEGHEELKTEALAEVDKIVAKASNLIAEARDRLGQIQASGVVETVNSAAGVSVKAELPVVPLDDKVVKIEKVGLPSAEGGAEDPGIGVPLPPNSPPRDYLPPDYSQLALERLAQMADSINNKANATVERIQASELSDEQKTELIGKVEHARTVALERLDDARNRLADADVSDVDQHAGQAGDAKDARPDGAPQSDERKTHVMTLIEAKQHTEQQTAIVPGTGGKPLAEKFGEKEATSTDAPR